MSNPIRKAKRQTKHRKTAWAEGELVRVPLARALSRLAAGVAESDGIVSGVIMLREGQEPFWDGINDRLSPFPNAWKSP
jgi:hypothetical protein